MSEPTFKDFDAAYEEHSQGENLATFVYEGETFEVDLNVNAGKMLNWMRGGQTLEAVPGMLVMFLGEEDFDRLCATDADWPKLQEVITWLAGELGGSGN